MTVLLWCCSLVLAAAMLSVWLRSPAPRTVHVETAVRGETPAPRVAPRTAVQTSAALIAIALALDVSSAAQAMPGVLEDLDQTLRFASVELAPAAYEAVWLPAGAGDGWFV